MYYVNMEQMMVRGSANHEWKEQHTFYMWDRLKDMKAQMWLAREHQVNTIPRIWDTGDLRQIKETSGSRPHPMDTLFPRAVLKFLQQPVMKSVEPRAKQYDHAGSDIDIPSFVGMLQVYTDITTISEKENATGAYLVHRVLRNIAGRCCQYLIDHGHILVAFLLESTAEHENFSKPDGVVDGASVSASHPVVLLTDEMA